MRMRIRSGRGHTLSSCCSLLLLLRPVPSLCHQHQYAQAHFLLPSDDNEPQIFDGRDAIDLIVRTNVSHPVLHCWCVQSGADQHHFDFVNLRREAIATRSLRHLGLVEIEQRVVLQESFPWASTCWFRLESDCDDTSGCGVFDSPRFTILPTRRLRPRPRSTTGYRPLAASRANYLPNKRPPPKLVVQRRERSVVNTTADDPPDVAVPFVEPTPVQKKGASLSVSATVGLTAASAVAAIAAGAMVAFFYFRRRRRIQEAKSSGNSQDSATMCSKQRPTTAHSGSQGSPSLSTRSERSQEPILEAVFDGFPGSTGYDDVRSLHPGVNLHTLSPGGDSPTLAQYGGWYGSPKHRDRDELAAARLQSSSSGPNIISYGPNRVTPTLTPRPSIQRDYSQNIESISIDSREGSPPMASITNMPSYASFQNYGYSNFDTPPRPVPAPKAQKPVAPMIIQSYGPNRVTPTPAIVSPTVPPDEGIIHRRVEQSTPQNHARPHQPRERPFSFIADSDSATAIAPLPPYASADDFYAMEKGAIRKLTEPQAQAELPPTKDGYYHDGVDVTEYELPGALPGHEPQLPYDPFKNAGPGRAKNIDEQKFLLDELLADADIAQMKAQKNRAKEMGKLERTEAAEHEMRETGWEGGQRWDI